MLELYLYCLGILETHGNVPPSQAVEILKHTYNFDATEQEVVTALNDINAGKVINIENVFRCKLVCEHPSSAQTQS